MADDKQPPAADAEETPPAKKSKLMLFLIIGLVALGGGGATVYFLFLRGGPPPAAEMAADTAPAPPANLAIMSLDPFVVNLAGPDSDRFAKISVRLLLPSQSAVDEIKEDRIKITRLRDRVITLLSSKTFAEINTAVGKETLRQELSARIEQSLDGVPVSDLLFAEFVVQ